MPPSGGTFLADFASDSGSDGEAEQPSPFTKPYSSSVSQTSDGIHPAFRKSTESTASETHNTNSSVKEPSLDITPEVRLPESRDLNTIEENEVAEVPPLSPIVDKTSNRNPDSPTLGPGLGMGGLVRAHLRASVASSIYPSSPAFPPPRSAIEDSPPRPPSSGPRMSNGYEGRVHSNPWEYDDLDNAYGPEPEQPTSTYVHPDITNMSMRAKQMREQAAALRGPENGDANEGPAHNGNGIPPPPPEPTWQDELRPGHHRGGSSETQAEREELANELAERRRKVQEKLKNFAESESRPSSPTFGHRFGIGGDGNNNHSSPSKSGNAFAMLRHKTPKPGKYDAHPSKAMKMLGMENPAHRAGSPSQMHSDHWRDEEHRMPSHHFGRGSRPSSPAPRHHQNWHRQRQDSSPPQSAQDERPPSRFAAQSGRETPRGRSSSDASLKSKGMPRYRDDLGPVGEQREDHHNFPLREAAPRRDPSGSLPSSARPSIETTDRNHIDTPPSATSSRFRSNSRTAGAPGPGYFDYDAPNSIQTSHAGFVGMSPRPSPMAPYSANATPPLFETSPTSSAITSPPITPQLAHAASNQPTQSLGTHRRTVDKSQISEPKFLSSTNNTPTVGLPPGASLSNGAPPPTPPVPPMNPRRKRGTTTQTILGALKVTDRDRGETPPPMPASAASAEERSMFSDDEKRPRTRQRLRKISSEGGNLNAKARQHLWNSNSGSTPALPQMPNKAPIEGGMF